MFHQLSSKLIPCVRLGDLGLQLPHHASDTGLLVGEIFHVALQFGHRLASKHLRFNFVRLDM